MSTPEKRTEERFPVSHESVCMFASPVLEDFGPLRLKNISTKGVGLITHEAVTPDLLLVLKLANPIKNFSKTVLARVVHVTPLPGNYFLIGCTLDTPLTYQELNQFVM